MQKLHYPLRPSLCPYVACLMTAEWADPDAAMTLPLYADGYPGIMFQQSDRGFYLLPKGKKLSELFLYGQTIHPVSLSVKGPYRFVVFQLYPFASNYLLGVDPRKLTDACYDLLQLPSLCLSGFLQRLRTAADVPAQIEIMSDIIETLLARHHPPADDRLEQAIALIIRSGGQLSMREVQEQVHLTERTLERNFLLRVGLTPKQFSSIIQFRSTLEKLDSSDFQKLTAIGLESGFADQSHFSRVFKTYTGLTPSQYRRKTMEGA